jgi:hypothetical protein
VSEDKVERTLGLVADVFEVVGIGGCLGFLAYVFTQAGAGATSLCLTIMVAPYFIGRHQAAKSFMRLLPAVKAKWERDRSEEP